MHAETIDNYLDRINVDLLSKGLTYDELREDLLDHICCMVEEEMESGKDFDDSYREIMSGIEDRVFPDIQHKTLLLLDKKFQRMKKITYVLGLVGAILAISGAIFKTLHWPGASIILSLGFLIVVLGFLPMYFIGSYQEQTEKPKLIYPVIAYLSLLFIFSAAIFKIMHWPGANWLSRISLVVLLVGFLPLYIVQIFKRTVKSKVNPAYIIMLLVGISIVLILSRVNLSKDSIDAYTSMTQQFEQGAILVSERTDKLVAHLKDPDAITEAAKIGVMAERLEMQIDQMLTGLLESVDQAGVEIDKVEGRDYRYGGRNAFNDNGLARNFLQDAREYKQYLLSISEDPLLENQTSVILMFSNGDWFSGWNPEDFVYEPLIRNYFKLTQFRYYIVTIEYHYINYLLEKERGDLY